jgi:DNA-directed RNA polymerase subunit RPC12/RpoP
MQFLLQCNKTSLTFIVQCTYCGHRRFASFWMRNRLNMKELHNDS